MNPDAGEGLELEHAGGRRSPATLAEVNDALAKYGARVWPLDLSDVSGDQRRLLDNRTLSGGVVQSLPRVGDITLFIDCPSPDHGWTVSYPGSHPHIASFTGASEGCKVLMQIIGPSTWTMDYVDADTR